MGVDPFEVIEANPNPQPGLPTSPAPHHDLPSPPVHVGPPCLALPGLEYSAGRLVHICALVSPT